MRFTVTIVVSLALAALGAAGAVLVRADQPEAPASPAARTPEVRAARGRLVIPRHTYQAIVVSATEAPRGVESVPFVVRARDADGVVSDFSFLVPVGHAYTLSFPAGWTNPTDAELFALSGGGFVAWGVTGGGGAGSMVRFDPLERDPFRDVQDREREREFEAFLRERARNK